MDIDDYERGGRAEYAAFANAVAAILRAAIGRAPELRLQQVTARAKTPDRLRGKLAKPEYVDVADITVIKDLAGCRVVFYTNSDVTNFVQSGIMRENFELRDVRIHHPRREATGSDLFISDNYTVALKAERLAMPEYARFKDMQCEVQIQTILNHAWSEMAHDTIYKRPQLDGFGEKALEGVERRLVRVMREHLLPAGYEFQKIASDFERLLAGKQLFDRQPLDEIVEAADNNQRVEAIERFATNVLPFYDNAAEEYSLILERLVDAIERAREVATKPIETPGGNYDGKTIDDVASEAVEIIERLRYADLNATFSALLRLYLGAATDGERSTYIELGKRLATHELAVWKQYGPAAQIMLVAEIRVLEPDQRERARPLLVPILDEILSPEVGGTTTNFDSITIHRGSVTASTQLREVRSQAIDLLEAYLESAENDADRRAVVSALASATETPHTSTYSNQLALMVSEDAKRFIGALRRHAPSWSLELRQSIEDRALRLHWIYRTLPEYAAGDEALAAAQAALLSEILALRDELNADEEFIIYKTLVGHDSVYPAAWDGDPFDFEERDRWRKESAAAFVADFDDESADRWLATAARCAQTESNDLATFPALGEFLVNITTARPDLLLARLGELPLPLYNFLPGILRGLIAADRVDDVRVWVDRWTAAGEHLVDLAFFLRANLALEQEYLERLLHRAIQLDDCDAVLSCTVTAGTQYRERPGSLTETVFLPSVAYLRERGDTRWTHAGWFSWRKSSLLENLDARGAEQVLSALEPIPRIEHRVDDILTAIAATHPAAVMEFFERRIARRATLDRRTDYQSVPYQAYELRKPLARSASALVDGAYRWFEQEKRTFQFYGGPFVASIFPDLPEELQTELARYVSAGGEDNLRFVVDILKCYEGSPATHELCKAIVESLPEDDDRLSWVRMVLISTGVVSGEFGFVQAHEAQRSAVAAWLEDDRPKVRNFAARFIKDTEQTIAAEQRAAEESMEFRRREWDQPQPDDDDAYREE